MAALEIIGFDFSNWVRAARIACEEKGVSHTLTPPGTSGLADLKTEAHLTIHPFGRMPALRHGDVTLFETLAIGLYVDRMFDGPALWPTDKLEAARSAQWFSACLDYVSRSIMGRFVVPYAFPKEPGKPDRAAIEAALPDVRGHLAILNTALAAGPYLHGETPYLDDFVLMTMLDMMVRFPEGPALLGGAPNVARHHATFQHRPSYAATLPERFRETSAPRRADSVGNDRAALA
jgi:glutathione S-transferase